jgi:hypothetical protein
MKETEYLFNRSWNEELSNEEEDVITDRAEQIISEYGWTDTFAAWNQYLKTNCTTPESVVNFANLFWWYGGQDHLIPDPYDFLGYLYYRVELEPEKYNGEDILDSIAITILPKAGYSNADLVLHPDYMPENDPELIASVERYRNEKITHLL